MTELEQQYIRIENVKLLQNIRTNAGEDLNGLMHSIEQIDLLHPIGVTKEGDDYVIAFGNRRFLAVQKLGWKKLIIGKQVVILPFHMAEEEFELMNVAENTQRKDLLPIELGRWAVHMIEDFEWNPKMISFKLDMPIERVKGAINLFKQVPPEEEDSIGNYDRGHNDSAKHGKIPPTVATTIIAVTKGNKDAQRSLFAEAKRKGLTLKDLALIGTLMHSGFTYEEALKKREDFFPFQVNLIAKIGPWEKLRKKYGGTTQTCLAIFSGKVSVSDLKELEIMPSSDRRSMGKL